MAKKDKIIKIVAYLDELFWDSKIELNYETPFQLLVAVIMSAQTTDKQVNKVNLEFFKVLKEPSDVKILGVEWIKNYINSIWFFNNKAKFIYETGIILERDFNSIIPSDIKTLQSLPWVWVKTAKVVLSNLYNLPYIAVDTHVHRVLNRIWIVKTKLPEQTDVKIDKVFNDEIKLKLHHNLVLFWRYHCKARSPECGKCELREICKYFENGKISK